MVHKLLKLEVTTLITEVERRRKRTRERRRIHLLKSLYHLEKEAEVNASTGNDKAGEGRDLYVVQIETIMTELSP